MKNIKTLKFIYIRLLFLVFIITTIPCFSVEEDCSQNFHILHRDFVTEATASFVAVSPTAGFIATTNTEEDTISILDTLNYSTIIDPIKVGKGPLGIAFSPEGDQIFVANSKEGTLSILTALPDTPYNFTKITIPLVNSDDSPQQLKVYQDGDNQYVFVTVDCGENQNGYLAIFKKEKDTYNLKDNITLGKSPRGIALRKTDNGCQLYIANSKDNNIISVIKYQEKDSTFVSAKPIRISKITPRPYESHYQPIGVEIVEVNDVTYLFVACSASGEVYITNADQLYQSKFISVGKSPRQIAVTPDQRHAFITCQEDSTVLRLDFDSIMNTWSRSDSIKLPSDITPNGIAVMPSGAAVLIANQNKPLLSILTLAQYQVETAQVTSPQPTHVLPTKVTNCLFSWHDCRIQIPGQSIPPGITVNTFDPSNPSDPYSILDQALIISAVTSPESDYVYSISKNNSTVSIIPVNSPNDFTNFQLPGAPSGGGSQYPIGLTLSGDGKVLFILTSYEDHSTRNLGIVILTTIDKEIHFNQLLFSQLTDSLFCSNHDGSKLFITDSAGSQIWTLINQSQKGYDYILDQKPLPFCTYPRALAISPNDAFVIALNSYNGENSLWHLNTQDNTVSQMTFPATLSNFSPSRMILSGDGEKLFITDTAIAGLRIVDAKTLQFMQTLSFPGNFSNPHGMAEVSDGSIYIAFLDTNNIGRITKVSQ